jgi:hypothetical protein
VPNAEYGFGLVLRKGFKSQNKRPHRNMLVGRNMNDYSTPKPVRTLQSVDMLMLNSIDEALSLLGEAPKSAIYFHLEHSFGIKKTDILFHTEEFYDVLERIFGVSTIQLQTLFLRKLRQKMGASCLVVPTADYLTVRAAYNQNTNA